MSLLHCREQLGRACSVVDEKTYSHKVIRALIQCLDDRVGDHEVREVDVHSVLDEVEHRLTPTSIAPDLHARGGERWLASSHAVNVPRQARPQPGLRAAR